ncbi:BrnT family toxin [Nitrosomonas sp. Is35]|uniref:BrnT family toxin n=1 Tax=Nitrosomonas sp. Is35 TaxID=3080534 RepID=UPI00294B6415|nr:BrnT family toxin [Nitrosomonas sp. Is35]MDV6346697.1 BrnT family toxin [Nitrosomonas sp. Is35]
MIEFEWDTNKAASNLKKHGISFEEAQSVFYDDFAVQFFDENSVSEDRFLMLGMSNEA